ncbi:MAG TPA: hypothetical protein VFP91_23340, partial [Vicinamibacterales bacterium]|nr:hypothetical protein [Vicinamibacterales bacterium]
MGLDRSEVFVPPPQDLADHRALGKLTVSAFKDDVFVEQRYLRGLKLDHGVGTLSLRQNRSFLAYERVRRSVRDGDASGIAL